jgi:hypothetical protein
LNPRILDPFRPTRWEKIRIFLMNPHLSPLFLSPDLSSQTPGIKRKASSHCPLKSR